MPKIGDTYKDSFGNTYRWSYDADTQDWGWQLNDVTIIDTPTTKPVVLTANSEGPKKPYWIAYILAIVSLATLLYIIYR